MSKMPLVRIRALATAVATLTLAPTILVPRVALGQSDAPAQSVDAEQQWRSDFDEAKLAFSEQRFGDAKRLLLKAAAIRMTPNIMANLAQVELQLGEYRLAANHASEALAGLGHNAAIEEDLANAAKHLGKILVRSNVDAAAILIDGEPVGSTPMVRPRYAEPGQHRIVLAKPGYREIARDIDLQLATEVQAEILLLPEPAVTSKESDPSPKFIDSTRSDGANQHDSNSARIVILAVGGAVAVGGLVAGFYLNANANSNAEKADALNALVGRDGCSQPGGSVTQECGQLLDQRKAEDRNRNWSTTGFVVGGAAVVGTVAYWLWPRNQAKVGAPRGLIRGGASPDGAWIGYQRNF